jgi:hypothetical protein
LYSYKKYNEKEWKDLFEWVEIARMSSDETKAETLKFLKELKERNS